MPQGNMKVKAKLPSKSSASSVHRGKSNKKVSKGKLFLLAKRRFLFFLNPVLVTKKSKPLTTTQRFQIEVTKEINKNILSMTRDMAGKFGETSSIDKKQ